MMRRPLAMSNEILNMEDVFQIEGRGTVVTGIRGSGWDLAKAGDPVELRPPGGHSIRTAIREWKCSAKVFFLDHLSRAGSCWRTRWLPISCPKALRCLVFSHDHAA